MSDASYFAALTRALNEEGVGWPVLVIDRPRLEKNIDLVRDFLPSDMGWRVVAKSLPSQGLLDFVTRRAETSKLMVFNLAFLEILAEQKGWDMLLGKPLPAAALTHFLRAPSQRRKESLAAIQFLADTPARIAQYHAIAQSHGLTLNINLELDVGLGRGGFASADALGEALTRLQQSNHLAFSGFMGYEPHIPMVPEEQRPQAWEFVQKSYRAAISQAQAQGWEAGAITRNAGGSPTYRLYEDTAIANEISAGSVLLKPSHFDMPLLAPHTPACFIATPLLKAAAGKKHKRLFIYGGKWMADPVWPEGVECDPIFGDSSNQQGLLAPPDSSLAADDWIFLRPHQSEAVLLQFGDLAVYDGERIENFWPVFPAAA